LLLLLLSSSFFFFLLLLLAFSSFLLPSSSFFLSGYVAPGRSCSSGRCLAHHTPTPTGIATPEQITQMTKKRMNMTTTINPQPTLKRSCCFHPPRNSVSFFSPFGSICIFISTL